MPVKVLFPARVSVPSLTVTLLFATALAVTRPAILQSPVPVLTTAVPLLVGASRIDAGVDVAGDDVAGAAAAEGDGGVERIGAVAFHRGHAHGGGGRVERDVVALDNLDVAEAEAAARAAGDGEGAGSGGFNVGEGERASGVADVDGAAAGEGEAAVHGGGAAGVAERAAGEDEPAGSGVGILSERAGCARVVDGGDRQRCPRRWRRVR